MTNNVLRVTDAENAVEAAKQNGHGGGGMTVTEALQNITYMVTELIERQNALTARVIELEARPSLEDAGVWDEREQYRLGEVVTHDGSAWVFRGTKNGRPGHSNSWRLLVKRGKDGRDARGAR